MKDGIENAYRIFIEPVVTFCVNNVKHLVSVVVWHYFFIYRAVIMKFSGRVNCRNTKVSAVF